MEAAPAAMDGTGVIGGMLSATLRGGLFVPIFFVAVMSVFRKRPGR